MYPAKAQTVVAHVPAGVDSLQPEALKYAAEAIEQSKEKGVRVRVLILCNPHNPLARAYPLQTILAYARFAEQVHSFLVLLCNIRFNLAQHDLHLLVDEVYANQVFASSFEPHPPPFISILSLDVLSLAGCDPSRVHVLAGPTKDFGASGVKVGAFVSQHNPSLVKLMRAALYAIPMSSAADALFTPILRDKEFSDWFLEENRNRLREAFELVGEWCQFHQLQLVLCLLECIGCLSPNYVDSYLHQLVYITSLT